MDQHETARNLLFGALAVELDLIDTDQLARACSAWASRRDLPLADLLHAHGWITPDGRAKVDGLLKRKLAEHGGGAYETLTSISGWVRALGGVDDFAIRATLSDSRSQSDLELTTTLDPPAESLKQYVFIRLHAEGGLGRVWLAHDTVLGREVALKELRPDRADNPACRARFLQEACITGQLENAGIVPVYELAAHPGEPRPFYTMRFVKGRTLAEAARAFHARYEARGVERMELIRLLDAFVAACHTMEYVHSRGVIHRDLKGQNIVLSDFGEVYVLDWGLAKVVGRPEGVWPTPPVRVEVRGAEEQTLPGEKLGTAAYMAPEQAEGRLTEIGPGTDVYGLGAVLYEVLTGRSPFGGSGVTEALRRVIEEEPPPPRRAWPAVSPALEAICLKALAKRPGDRYPSTEALAEDVQLWLADEPVAAYRDPPLARLGRWGRRHGRTVAVAAAMLMVTTASLPIGRRRCSCGSRTR